MVESAERYRLIFHLAEQMRAAARDADWDRLIEIDALRASLLGELERDLPADAVPDASSAALIREILDCDAETHRLAGAWVAELGDILKTLSVARKLENTYR